MSKNFRFGAAYEQNRFKRELGFEYDLDDETDEATMTLVTPWEKYRRLHVRSVMPNDMSAFEFGFEADMDSHDVSPFKIYTAANFSSLKVLQAAFGIAYDFRQTGGVDNTILIKYKHSFNGSPEVGELGLKLSNVVSALVNREVVLAVKPLIVNIHFNRGGEKVFEAVTRYRKKL